MYTNILCVFFYFIQCFTALYFKRHFINVNIIVLCLSFHQAVLINRDVIVTLCVSLQVSLFRLEWTGRQALCAVATHRTAALGWTRWAAPTLLGTRVYQPPPGENLIAATVASTEAYFRVNTQHLNSGS